MRFDGPTSFSAAQKAGDGERRRIYASVLFSSWVVVLGFVQGGTAAL